MRTFTALRHQFSRLISENDGTANDTNVEQAYLTVITSRT
jgi:hypothetical protein